HKTAFSAQGQEAPSDADLYSLYQTIVASWDFDLDLDDPVQLDRYADRLIQWQTKALREAKIRSSWYKPNTDYEEVCTRFIGWLLKTGTKQDGRPLDALGDFVEKIAPVG